MGAGGRGPGVGRVVLAALGLLAAVSLQARVKTGLDVLVEQNFAPLAGKRVGVITNHSAFAYDRRHIVDLLAKAPNVKLTAIFAPEHGFTGTEDEEALVASGKHPAAGVPIFSLFQRDTQRPTPEMLKNVDALVYDIQDVGVRFYTYITTLGYTLEEAAKAKIPYYVLDRPNPINGVAVEGPLLAEKYFSFVGYMRMPIRHGMTVGELARMYNGEKKLGAVLHVIEMQGWNRRMWFDETGLEWVNPSPNLRSFTQVILYPGTCLLEQPHQVSVGRGTEAPFQIVGAPWFKSLEVAEYLNSRNIPGVRFIARRFRPTDAPYKGEWCEGLDVQLLNRDALDAVRMGLELVAATLKFHPGKLDLDSVRALRILGSGEVAARLKRGENASDINVSLQGDLAAFRKMREKYLLYK